MEWYTKHSQHPIGYIRVKCVVQTKELNIKYSQIELVSNHVFIHKRQQQQQKTKQNKQTNKQKWQKRQFLSE